MTPEMRQTPEVLFARDVARSFYCPLMNFRLLLTHLTEIGSFVGVAEHAGLAILLRSFDSQEKLVTFKLA